MLVIQFEIFDGDIDSVIFITVCMIVWQICFRHNFFKKLSPRPKNVSKDAPRNSLQSALKIML